VTNIINFAIRHSISGGVVLMFYEACGESVIEVTYRNMNREKPAGQNMPEHEYALTTIPDAKDEAELKVAEMVAQAHQGKLVALRRRRPNGTIVRLQIPIKARLK